MKPVALVLAFVALPLLTAGAQQPADGKPTWAYAVAPGPAPTPGAPQAARGGRAAQPPDPTLVTLPGSRFSFTRAQVRDAYAPADWFPEDHPVMPEVVAHGRQPDARACGFCHMPNGKGRPENAPVAGLPKDYIVRQLLEFRSGARATAEPRKPNDMLLISQRLTDDDIREASEYFSSMPWTQWIRVVEVDVVPKTRIAGQMFHLVDDGTTEPIGNRIVEAPENEAEEQLRAPRTGFVAYVPKGSIKRGEALVTTGAGKTYACTVCHSPDLRGLGPVPGLANRSPSYLARQPYDFQQGTRAGVWSPLMKAVVANLTVEDMVNILAYTASRKP
jgi:cytochrome c553